jgi:hypothetical protein
MVFSEGAMSRHFASLIANCVLHSVIPTDLTPESF